MRLDSMEKKIPHINSTTNQNNERRKKMKKLKRIAREIEWDVDYPEDLEFLPTEIEIPDDVADEDVANYLSDETGYCHFGFVLDTE